MPISCWSFNGSERSPKDFIERAVCVWRQDTRFVSNVKGGNVEEIMIFGFDSNDWGQNSE
jgi:hypothetical protein